MSKDSGATLAYLIEHVLADLAVWSRPDSLTNPPRSSHLFTVMAIARATVRVNRHTLPDSPKRAYPHHQAINFHEAHTSPRGEHPENSGTS